MRTTQATTRRLADRAATRVTAMWALVASGEMTRAQFRTEAAALVAAANTAGVQIADIGLAAEITRQVRIPTPPLGLVPNRVQVDQERIARDIDRIVQRTDDPAPELGQWSRSEQFLTVATAVQAAMAERGIARWTRQLSGQSCPLCTGWADGVARPVTVPMIRHNGCDCIQQPALG